MRIERKPVVALLANLVLAVAGLVLGGPLRDAVVPRAHASESHSAVSADEALKSLMEGNKRFVENRMTCPSGCGPSVREKLARGQQPYAIILSCSDSRVPPELIFDKGLGEIFVVRVAGNVPDLVVLGSIEYAAEHLGSPLVVVLGHSRCGAVTAAVDAHGEAEGNIGSILKAIAPAVEAAKQGGKEKEKPSLVEAAIRENAKRVAANLTKGSHVLAKLAGEGKLKIVAAEYSLDDGKVARLDTAK